MTTVFRFVHQLNQALYNKIAEVPETCLRLWLLAAAAADECGLEELTYEFFVQVSGGFELFRMSVPSISVIAHSNIRDVGGIIGIRS